MPIKICVAGATGWTGRAVTQQLLESAEARSVFQLVGAVARQATGRDLGEVLGLPSAGVTVVDSVQAALTVPTDVLIDFTSPAVVKANTLAALDHGVRVVIGTSGLTAADYAEIGERAQQQNLGVIAAGNFSITAALAKHFSILAARHLPSWEIIDYAKATKIDAPSGTVRELAEALGKVAQNKLDLPIEQTFGSKEARGGSIAGTQVHSVRLHGYTLAFETLFGLPDERLTIRHDSGSSALPYVGGTLLAAQKVMDINGLVRGMDQLLFGAG